MAPAARADGHKIIWLYTSAAAARHAYMA